MEFSTIAGWIGFALALTAYALNILEAISNTSAGYRLMNLFGGAGLACSTYAQEAWPAMALNTIWALIALFALTKSFLTEKSRT